MQRQKKKTTINPESCGLWQGCDGAYYTAAGRCYVCGKPRADHLSAGTPLAISQRNPVKTLDIPTPNKTPLLRVHGALRVRITRGYGAAGGLDFDNLAGACKSLRDQITEKILCLPDDKETESLIWEYRQAPGKGVLIEFFEVKPEKV